MAKYEWGSDVQKNKLSLKNSKILRNSGKYLYIIRPKGKKENLKRKFGMYNNEESVQLTYTIIVHGEMCEAHLDI